MNQVVPDKKIERRLDASEIFEHLQTIADRYHRGDLQNNIHHLFKNLREEEQQALLKKSVLLFWEHHLDLTRRELDQVVIDEDTTIDRGEVNKERKAIEDFNYEEQIRLKSWFQKMVFIIGVSGFIVLIALTQLIGGSKTGGVEGLMNHLSKILGLLF